MSAALSVVPTRPPTKMEVNAAWRAFQKLGRELADDPKLIADRDFMERMARAEADWKRLFLASDRQS
jgi:hypothetical protein